MKRQGLLWIILSLFVVLGLLVGVFGCTAPATPTPTSPAPTGTQPSTTPTKTPTPTVTAAPITLKIGASLPLSGSASSWGVGCQRALNMAADEINAAGGVVAGGQKYNLQVITYDDKYTAEGGVTVTTRLIYDDKVDFMVGPFGSTASLAAQAAVLDKVNVLEFNHAYSAGAIGPAHPLSMRICLTQNEIDPTILAWAQKNLPNVKTLAIISANDASGQAMNQSTNKYAPQFGFKVVFNDFFDRPTTDFRPLITRVMLTNPDGVYYSGMVEGETALAQKQLREAGFKGPTFYHGATVSSTFIATAGVANADGYVVTDLPAPGSTYSNPWLDRVAQQYQAQYNEHIDLFAMNHYNAVYLIKLGVEKAGSTDPFKVQAALRSGQLDTVFGPVVFGGTPFYGAQSQFLYPIGMVQIQGGKPVTTGIITIDMLKSLVGT